MYVWICVAYLFACIWFDIMYGLSCPLTCPHPGAEVELQAVFSKFGPIDNIRVSAHTYTYIYT